MNHTDVDGDGAWQSVSDYPSESRRSAQPCADNLKMA